MKKSFADILNDAAASKATKVASKLPHWASEDLEYPDSLCLEQCSSEETALHKATLTRGFKRIADLTGGLGVDSWAFSQNAGQVFYNERNNELCKAVERNFNKLRVRNVEFHSFDIDPGKDDWQIALKAFAPDCIYLDPARRGASGKKMFRPEDCQPDILKLLPVLYGIASDIVVKLSPMADISVLCTSFKPFLKKLQVVQSGGEVKELLCITGAADENTEPLIEVINGGATVLGFRRSEEENATVSFPAAIGGYLLEPHAALLKSGAFRLPCERFRIDKIATSTHLYVSKEPFEGGVFKNYAIIDTLPMGKKSLSAIGKAYPHADVTVRNLPLGSDELRSRMKITPGNNDGTHIFGCGTENGGRILIVTKKFVNTK